MQNTNHARIQDVSFVPDPTNPLPVVLPMIARAGTVSTRSYPNTPLSCSGKIQCVRRLIKKGLKFPPGDGEAAIYVHGYVSARMFRQQTGRSEPATLDADEGFPVCIAATKIDNLVLALTPFNHSCRHPRIPQSLSFPRSTEIS